MSKAILSRSKDGKVANAVTPDGKKALLGNSFGIPSGVAFSCIAQTAFCALICYAGTLERLRPNVKALLVRNWQALQGISRSEMFDMLDHMITEFEAECDKRSAPKLFRIHWDGDFFSTDYMIAWSKVVAAHQDTQFWVYTRVPASAVYLHKLKLANLGLYFSGDRDNIDVAKHLATQGINVAFVGSTWAEAEAALPGATRCPENNRALPLIDAKGSACARCGLCVYGRKNVLFSVKKSPKKK